MSHVLAFLTFQEKYQILTNRINSLYAWYAATVNYRNGIKNVNPLENPMYYGLIDVRSPQEIAQEVESIWVDMKDEILKELEADVDQI